MIRFGLLGCGRIGIVHARSLGLMQERATLVAVADALPAAAEALAKRHGAEVRPAEALIASSDIDAVIIATPTTTHFDLIHAAAAAGKAIFCEKPIDLSPDRARRCFDTIEATNVPFLTAFQRRFDTSLSVLEARIREGEIGQVELIIMASRDPSPPPVSYIETSGGIYADMMIHDLDMARFLLNEEPTEVYAVGSNLVDPAIGEAGDVDTAAVTLKTKSGAICQITCSRRASYGYDQRVEVHGSKGMLSMKNMPLNLIETADGNGFTTAPAQPFFLQRYGEAYANEMAYFVSALEQGTTMRPTALDGLRAQIIAEAAKQSFQTGQPALITE